MNRQITNYKLQITNLNVWYDSVRAVKDISLEVKANEILGIIGPANSGKTSFLKTPLNLLAYFFTLLG